MEHTYLGYASSGAPLWLTLEQRLRHIAVNGKTGYGKSTELKSVLAQDIARGDGVLLLDPAGTLAEDPTDPKKTLRFLTVMLAEEY